MDKMRQDNWVLSIHNCARCGQDHERVVFEKFYQPVVDEDGTEWQWHGVCPTTSEPILMRSDPIEPDVSKQG